VSRRAGTSSWKPDWRALLVALLAAAVVSALGSMATDTGPWFRALDKPPWQPPDWVFGPVWTAIYLMAALSAALAWTFARFRTQRLRVIALFALNGALNVLWTVLFFALRRPDWALIEIGFLWLSIASLMIVVWPTARASTWLLAPYLAWVSYAAAINVAIVRRNAPFDGVETALAALGAG
jgi:translocator protein